MTEMEKLCRRIVEEKRRESAKRKNTTDPKKGISTTPKHKPQFSQIRRNR